jgi:hypothetical protein
MKINVWKVNLYGPAKLWDFPFKSVERCSNTCHIQLSGYTVRLNTLMILKQEAKRFIEVRHSIWWKKCLTWVTMRQLRGWIKFLSHDVILIKIKIRIAIPWPTVGLPNPEEVKFYFMSSTLFFMVLNWISDNSRTEKLLESCHEILKWHYFNVRVVT